MSHNNKTNHLQLNNEKTSTKLSFHLNPDTSAFVSPARTYHIKLSQSDLPLCEETSKNCELSLTLKTSSLGHSAPCNYSLVCPVMTGGACADQGLLLEGQPKVGDFALRLHVAITQDSYRK